MERRNLDMGMGKLMLISELMSVCDMGMGKLMLISELMSVCV